MKIKVQCNVDNPKEVMIIDTEKEGLQPKRNGVISRDGKSGGRVYKKIKNE